MHFQTVEGPAIPRFKAHVRRMNLSIKPDRVIKAEYDSTAKLDGDSRAFTSKPTVYGPLDNLANFGIVPLAAKVAIGTSVYGPLNQGETRI